MPLHLATMSGKKRSLVEDLASMPGVTKCGLAVALQTMHAHGVLTSSIGTGSTTAVRKRLAVPLQDLREMQSPYGPLIRHVSAFGVSTVEVVNPHAYLYHMAKISDEMSDLLFDASAGGDRAVRIVLYMDSIAPGNPLRPEKSRTTECLYWTIVDFPDHVLSNVIGWFVFSTIRRTTMDDDIGGPSVFMRIALQEFWNSDVGRPDFERGVMVDCRRGACLIRASFAGFLADEKALKEFMGLKGAGGSKPCIVCRNVVQFVDADCMAGSRYVGIDVVDRRLLEHQSNDDIYRIIDRLKHTRAHSPAQLKHEEQVFGVSYVEGGLLFDDQSRLRVRPVDHYIRDPMHVLLSGGVASTHTAVLLAALADLPGARAQAQAFVGCFVMPKAGGRNPRCLLDDKRVTDDHMRCFASELLDLAPLLLAFLQDAIAPRDLLVDNVRCYSLLVRILQICTMGARRGASFVDELRRCVDEHHALYKRLYPSAIKPKWHQMLHIPDDAADLGLLLSCFVTERKHKTVKRAAVWTFRHYDHTLIADVVYRELENLRSSTVLFSKESLISPVAVHDMEASNNASFVFGEVRQGDLVACRGGRIMEAQKFWGKSNSIVAQGRPLVATERGTHWRKATSGIAFVPSNDLVAVVAWAQQGDTLRIILPSRGLGFE